MKGIKLILLSVIAAAMLTSCGMNNSNSKATPTPGAAQNNSGNVNNTNNGTVTDNAKDAGSAAGNAAKDVGDAAGNAVKDVGDAAGNIVEDAGNAAGDVMGANDSNNNGK